MNFKSKILKHKIKLFIGLFLLLVYYFSLPRNLFQEPYSTVIESAEGELLAAQIATDGQWRFPAPDSIPDKFKHCIIQFEDQHFNYHWGFNPMAIYKAFRQNSKAGKVVRGGSTLTQQVIRLARKNQERTYFEKLKELILATRLEFRYSKESILKLYAAHAPFGGNVVGLEMASWRYFGVQAHQLSWAQTATLAVLPNAPKLIYPGKNQQILLEKRNRLLQKLFDKKIIDKATYQLSLIEPLPSKPYNLPQIAPHLLQHIADSRRGERIKTTVTISLQNRVNQLVSQYYNVYKQTEVYNIAVLVVDVETRNVRAYVGNSPTDNLHQKDVDIITAPRSTGSILKPFLYASMLDAGELLPNTLVADIPTQIAGYSPENFNKTFDGAVPAHRALARSLNIPSVLLLKKYGVDRFYELLQNFQLKDINKPANHYGLSLILGGAESNLWDLCKTYSNLTSTLNFYTKNTAYRTHEFQDLNMDASQILDFGTRKTEKNQLGAGAIWLTYQAMKQVGRPEGDEAWQFYDSSLQIAWKTGTSFGNRDAWAIGTSKKYVVGVWVGNATGEGRPTLTGVSTASPILFDVFRLLPQTSWFTMPYKNLSPAEICTQSGHIATEYCPKTNQWIPKKGSKTLPCPYHKKVFLDATLSYQVNSSCEDIENIVPKIWFVLPPVMEYYYKTNHIDYQTLPPFKPDCLHSSQTMEFIYPKENGKLQLTKDFSGKIQPFIAKIAHSQTNIEVFWYLDNTYIGSTKKYHEIPIETQKGTHYLTATDELGNEITRKISIH